MYPNQSSPQQWNPNAATPTSQSAPQPGWSPQPPNGQYAPRPPNQIPPISQALPQQGPAMQTLQPQHPEQYRALPPPHMYGPPYQQGPPMAYAPQQPAPRQRTAIACRYCRRRKIRCSGFDQSEDGRCTNCQRFSQECIFTPVSAQTQAFVPAHTVWRGQNPPQGAQLYGAYGQPLPQHGGRDPYPPQQPGQYPPPPQGYQQPPMYGQPPPQVQTPQAGQKRSSDEPHTPTLPPPHPGAQADMSQQPYGYPQPPAGASPASSTASSFNYPVPAYYYDPYQYARASPQSAYSYEASQASSSPNALAQHGSPVPPSVSHSSYTGHTSSPGSVPTEAQRQGVKINELVGPAAKQQAAVLKQQEERTSTDTSMVQALNRRADHAGDPSIPPNSTKKNGVDIGVQTEDSLMHKEPAS